MNTGQIWNDQKSLAHSTGNCCKENRKERVRGDSSGGYLLFQSNERGMFHDGKRSSSKAQYRELEHGLNYPEKSVEI